jgi:hypothetical protein
MTQEEWRAKRAKITTAKQLISSALVRKISKNEMDQIVAGVAVHLPMAVTSGWQFGSISIIRITAAGIMNETGTKWTRSLIRSLAC